MAKFNKIYVKSLCSIKKAEENCFDTNKIKKNNILCSKLRHENFHN